ncbi:MAG: hypothetical protein UT02_C0029G0006 [Parcubacteria group bacterium GW2011_GWC2_38_7]|nr:MAG: hypothetical protein UT02_C0029G0006 [Parcubacteria group bacterium GW2011_GWC2_38_7]
MEKKNKIIFLFLVIFLFFPLTTFAEATAFPILGESCTVGDICANGACEQSSLSGPQNTFCTCTSDSDCASRFGKKTPQETWTCKPGEAKTKNLHYCVSSTRGTQDPMVKSVFTPPPEEAASTEGKTILTAPIVSIPIPGLAAFNDIIVDPGEAISIPYIALYIIAIYKYGLVIGSILAVVMIMIGGIIYLSAAAAPERITTGKNLIIGAISGLTLLLGSYLLLKTINPNLVSPTAIKLDTIKGLVLEPGNETSEIMYNSIMALPENQRGSGMSCYFNTFGANEAAVKSQLTKVSFLGRDYNVHSLMAPKLQKVATEVNALGLPYKSTSGGSYAWRPNANNPAQLSLHSFAIAFDINPSKNPNKKRAVKCTSTPCPPCESDIPTAIVNILKNNGFHWGGDYKSVCDAMHFEWLGPCKY